jgi:hypothetical protein
MAYFWIEYGLRGAYCDGNGYIIQCSTRRELKAAIAWEADSLRDAGMIGASKRAVASLAADAWRALKRPSVYPYVMPVSNNGRDSYAWGIHCAPSTRREYLEYCAYCD